MGENCHLRDRSGVPEDITLSYTVNYLQEEEGDFRNNLEILPS